jgi:hypothetical protein
MTIPPAAVGPAGQDTTPPAAGHTDWTARGIEWASGATAACMFAYGVALSYSVLHRIAAAAGLPSWAAHLWPLGFEAFMASAALNALAEQRTRANLPDWWQRVPWYPWVLTALTAGGSILLNWFHPAIPLDPPPSWLVSLVYGLPPLAAVFAWHLFLQRLAHRRHARPGQDTAVPPPAGRDRGPEDEQDTQDQDAAGEAVPVWDRGDAGDGPSPAPEDSRVLVRALLAAETPQAPVTGAQVQAETGLSRSRAYALLRQERARLLRSGPNGQRPLAHPQEVTR